MKKKAMLIFMCMLILLTLSIQINADKAAIPMYVPHSCHEGSNHQVCYLEPIDENVYDMWCCCGKYMGKHID